MADNERFPTVLLRHDLPDGSHHFDWLLAQDGDGPLLTFRLDRDISLDTEAFEAERLADHRRVYLAYEGEISGGRGSVARVVQGHCSIRSRTEDLIRLWIDLGVRTGHLRGTRQSSGRYLFGLD